MEFQNYSDEEQQFIGLSQIKYLIEDLPLKNQDILTQIHKENDNQVIERTSP